MSTPTHQQKELVVFVCLHGSAKSVIAATQFRYLAANLGLAMDAESAGTEPDESYPSHVLEGLRQAGLSTPETKPRAATADALKDARVVVSFGPDVTPLSRRGADIRRWADVPNVSDGYATASEDIYRRVALLVDELQRSSTP
jgi:protein-tyrosine-phosphatase